jgi:hypothetical protein
LAKVRANLYGLGLRPRLQTSVIYYILGRLKSREAAAAMRNMEFRPNEVEAIGQLVPEAQKTVKVLKSRKTQSPRDAYFYIASLPPEMMAFVEVEMPNPGAMSKLRAYEQKWRPMRLALPVAELDALGVPRGPKFDKVLEDLFEMQLRGRARDPESRTKILKQLAGIKDEPKKSEKDRKKRKAKETVGKSAESAAHEGTAEKGKHSKQGAEAPGGQAAAEAAAKASGSTAKGGHAAVHGPARKHPIAASKSKARQAKKAGH